MDLSYGMNCEHTACSVEAVEEWMGPDTATTDALLVVLLDKAGDEVVQRHVCSATSSNCFGEDVVVCVDTGESTQNIIGLIVIFII